MTSELDTVRVTVSGKTFFGGLDPMATDKPREAGWPEASLVRAGKGHRASYTLTSAQASDMAAHLERLADGFQWSDDADAKAEARAFAADAAKIRATLAAH